MFDLLVSNPGRSKIFVRKDSLNSFISKDVSRDNTFRGESFTHIAPTSRETDRSFMSGKVVESKFDSRRNSVSKREFLEP